MSARLHLVPTDEQLREDAERHVAKRRNRTELHDIAEVVLAGLFGGVTILSLYALVLGWIEIIARVFGGG